MLFWFLRHLVRPLLGTVKHAQYPHSIADNAISSNVGRTVDNQLPRSLNPARTTHFRKQCQTLDACPDTIIDGDRGSWTIRFNVIEDGIAIGKGEDRPFQKHSLPLLIEQRSSAPFGEVRLNLLVRNARAWIIQSFLHLGAEP